MAISSNDLKKVLPLHLDWRNNLDACCEDEITIDNHWQLPNDVTYVRRTRWASIGATSGLADWVLGITVFNRDAQWLAGLSRADIANFINLESAFQ
jgi:hypothetical protein